MELLKKDYRVEADKFFKAAEISIIAHELWSQAESFFQANFSTRALASFLWHICACSIALLDDPNGICSYFDGEQLRAYEFLLLAHVKIAKLVDFTVVTIFEKESGRL